MEDQTLDIVRRLLLERYGSTVQVDLQERLDSPHIVLRCVVSGADLPATVIVKHAHEHCLNELAMLQFLGATAGEQVAPRVYAADVDDKLLVIEDFGDQPSLLDLLLTSTNPVQVEQAFLTYGTYLGRFHAASASQERAYDSLRRSMNVTAPACDTSEDVRSHADSLLELFAALQIAVPAGFHAELDTIGQLIHERGPFWVLAHCDAGPHNVLYLDDQVMLIDFEFGQYACGLMDLVSARMGFPHTLNMGRMPLALVQEVEQAYLHEFSRAIPHAADRFREYIVAACCHWALGRLGHYWRGYLKEYLEVGDAVNEHHRNYERTRRHQLTYIQSAKNTLLEFKDLPAMRRIFADLEGKLGQLWPGLEAVDLYPVFQK